MDAFYCCNHLTQAILPSSNSVGGRAFIWCNDLRKVSLPSARSISPYAFSGCSALRHIALHPTVFVARDVFYSCLSLEVLAASSLFLPTVEGDRTKGVTSYLLWRNEIDTARKERFYTFVAMLSLCAAIGERPPRATPNDPIMKFLVAEGCGKLGFARHLLSFLPQFEGQERGKGDLRAASNAELLLVGLELKVLRKEENVWNERRWGVKVNADGEVFEGCPVERADERVRASSI